MSFNYLTFEDLPDIFNGKSVAIVGSGPSSLNNDPGFVDSHDIVVRVNNFQVNQNTGYRTDVFYSYFGKSIRTSSAENQLLLNDTYLCMCKCPNDDLDSKWHKRRGLTIDSDFRWIYELRKDWWFCDTYIPTMERFKRYMNEIHYHIPTTGFSAILDISDFDCDIYLTGFDFFESGIHNVNEPWKNRNRHGPMGHVPHMEKMWLKSHKDRYQLDKTLHDLLI